MPIRKICCIGAGYVGGPTMAMIALKCPHIEVRCPSRAASAAATCSVCYMHCFTLLFLCLVPLFAVQAAAWWRALTPAARRRPLQVVVVDISQPRIGTRPAGACARRAS